MTLILKIVTIVSVACAVFGQEEDSCKTPTGIEGTCVLIRDCKKLQILIKGSISDREILKRHYCGFKEHVPMVCCSKNTLTVLSKSSDLPLDKGCITLDGTIGTCVDPKTCPNIINKLKKWSKKSFEYVIKSRCIKSTSYSVCCEKPNYKNEDTSTKAPEFMSPPCPPSPTLPDPNGKCCGIDGGGGNKIFNGLATSIEQYPWLAMIEYVQGERYLCSGSLISSQYVLTAAHCLITPTNLKPIGAKSVRLGEYNTTNTGRDCIEVDGGGKDCTDGAISIPIAATYIHPDFKIDKIIQVANDIALVKLNQMAPYSDFIRPICLPKFDINKSPPPNLQFFVAGWGAVNEYQMFSDVKLHVDLPYIDKTRCVKMFKLKDENVLEKLICAGAEPDKDSCAGDSGGPLMYYNFTKYEVTGIHSFGAVSCAIKNIPGVYTNVYDYIPWIQNIVNS